MCGNLSSCTGEIYIIIPTQYPPSKEKVMCVEMAYCTNCGKEIASNSKFCSACGKENAEYNPNGNKPSQEYDVTVTPKIRLSGPQDAKTEIYVSVPQLGKNMRILFPNFMELGQTIRVRGEGLYKPNGDRGDLLVTPSEIEYYDTEMTISARLIGASDAVTKMPLYLPHAGKTVQISVPNDITVGKTLRLKGLGLDAPNGEIGDLYLHFDHVDHAQEPATPPKDETEQDSAKRQQEYVGKVKKCPACGEEVPSLTAICPACGHEFSIVKGSESVASFISEIDACDKRIAAQGPTAKKGWSTWKTWKKVGWVLLNIYFFCIPLLIYFLRPFFRTYKSPALSIEEKRKATIIENFTFPNDRGSILEALLFIKSKVSFLANEKVNANNAYWMRLWVKKAEQLHQKAEMLFQGDRIANDAYTKIVEDHTKFKKQMQIRIFATLGIIAIAVIFLLICGCVANGPGGGKFVNEDGTYSNIPTISEGIGTNESEGIYTYQIRNYVGKNAASVGKIYGDSLVDEYGNGNLRIVFCTEDGILVHPNNDDQKKLYSVVGQNLPAGSELIIVHQRNSSGKPYDSLVSYQSHEEIVLFVASVGESGFIPSFTEISPTFDRHKYHVRDYVGRNAASFGMTSGDERIDEYGDSKLRITFTSTDGSFVDINDPNILKTYVVVSQDVEANADLIIQYQTNSSGKEYDSLIQYQNYEEINLTVRHLDDEIIEQMPIIDTTSNSSDNEELQIKYKVLSNGKAEITGYTGTGNTVTIDDKIDGHEVIAIADSAFKDCTTLKSVLFWADIKTIGEYAFAGCTALTEISIPNETTSIGAHAFEGCTSLSSLIIWGDPSIGDYAFAGCTSIPEVSISTGTKEVGAHAFDGCTSLISVIIWGDDTVIGKDAFTNCPNLKDRPIQE